MDPWRLKDLLARGMGLAAQKVGLPFLVYRPSGPFNPINEQNRVIRLSAAFEPEGGSRKSSTGVIWRGMFDSFYTRPGDYLVGQEQTFFVASQVMPLPARCVLVNRTVDMIRPVFASQGSYSGLYASDAEPILQQWPASITAAGAHGEVVLAGRVSLGSWNMLLPTGPAMPRAADVVSDDKGGSFVVEQAEQNLLGWRFSLRQVGA